MIRGMTDLLGMREIFWELQDIAKENPKILDPYAFFDWMCRNYFAAVTIGSRRFVDRSKDSHSLWRMLFEILEHPGSLSRRSHVSFYRNMPHEYGNSSFSNIIGSEGKWLSQKSVRSDLRSIEDASRRIQRFVNKRVAHNTGRGKLRRLPNLNELDAALDTIDKVLCKYNLLLTARGTTSAKATRQYEWTDVLRFPWIEQP
jgi:hypothetical protein